MNKRGEHGERKTNWKLLYILVVAVWLIQLVLYYFITEYFGK